MLEITYSCFIRLMNNHISLFSLNYSKWKHSSFAERQRQHQRQCRCTEAAATVTRHQGTGKSAGQKFRGLLE